MPVTNWNETIINGKRYLVIEVAQLRVPLDWDPSSNVFIAVAAPTGGELNYPALAQGDDGATPVIDTAINFTPLAYNDVTPDFASWTETSPNVYKLNLGLHKGAPGAPGDTVLDPSDFAGSLPGKVIVVNPANNAFILQTQKVGDWFYPASISNASTGNPEYTLCVVSIPVQDFDYRVTCEGQCVITGTGTDVWAYLRARLNGETGGNIVATGFGAMGVSPPTHILVSGYYGMGSISSFDKVLAGNAATVHLRVERQVGTGTFSTSASTTSFRVKVDPLP